MARSSVQLSRREWLRLSAAGVLGCSSSGWLERLAAATAKSPERKRACILLWMNGGPAQTDTFDLKPGHANGGPFKEIATTVPDLRFSEHLPLLAKQAKHLALVHSMLRDRYGRNLFGQGCLLACRLVERGVPFVEVTLNNAPGTPNAWDTHGQNFEQVKKLCEVLDPAWATLLEDLEQRGLLDTTLVVWMGEFGRTPRINRQQGRDHFPDAWSTVLCGGGIKGGTVHGKTSPDGMTIKDGPVAVPDFLATVAKALGIDLTMQNISNIGRPIRIMDAAARPIEEVLAF